MESVCDMAIDQQNAQQQQQQQQEGVESQEAQCQRPAKPGHDVPLAVLVDALGRALDVLRLVGYQANPQQLGCMTAARMIGVSTVQYSTVQQYSTWSVSTSGGKGLGGA